MQFGIDFLRSSLAVAVGCRESWLLPSSGEKKKKQWFSVDCVAGFCQQLAISYF